jgi:short-subunit dehydrogenase
MNSNGTKKYALVTGASSGIGADIAKELAVLGYHLILTARREDRLEEIARVISAENNIDIKVFISDLGQPSGAKDIYNYCKSGNYPIEVLVNNAGYGINKSFHNTSLEDEIKFLNVLGISVISLTKMFLPDMMERKSGKIMVISSIAAFIPPFTGPYKIPPPGKGGINAAIEEITIIFPDFRSIISGRNIFVRLITDIPSTLRNLISSSKEVL